MGELTPPSSHSGTPVRGLARSSRFSPGSNSFTMPNTSELDGQPLAGSSNTSPEQGMEELVDTDGSEDEMMDQDQDQDLGLVGATQDGEDVQLTPEEGGTGVVQDRKVVSKVGDGP